MLNSPPLTWMSQRVRLAKRDDARIEPVNERAEREEVERAVGSNLQRLGHEGSSVSGVQSV